MGSARWRSISACAEEPSLLNHSLLKRRVYLRVRGGTVIKVGWQDNPWGLSPRARRNHDRRSARRSEARSISACAEEPRSPVNGPSCQRVYLRVRGGTNRIKAGPKSAKGLSPRARRNHA
ncbi:Hypothetical protein GbCGDNIH6_1629b [Granulibacter bethesdensis]|nr:Hypothetical protein GbCGDNIH6_1629b [Granulibacter bethesdensis]